MVHFSSSGLLSVGEISDVSMNILEVIIIQSNLSAWILLDNIAISKKVPFHAVTSCV